MIYTHLYALVTISLGFWRVKEPLQESLVDNRVKVLQMSNQYRKLFREKNQQLLTFYVYIFLYRVMIMMICFRIKEGLLAPPPGLLSGLNRPNNGTAVRLAILLGNKTPILSNSVSCESQRII